MTYLLLLLVFSCEGPQGPQGEDGDPGSPGQNGEDGSPGEDGANAAFACVSVRDFGGVGDGVTDDTVAIQAAIDSLPTWTGYGVASGGRICLPAGTWRISAPIQVPDYVSIQGEGMYSSTLVLDPSAEPFSAIERKGTNAQKNLMFFDLGIFLSHEDSVGFDLRYITRAVVERCLVYNTAYVYGSPAQPPGGTGVLMQAGSGLSGYDNRVLNNEMWGLAFGVYVGEEAHATTIMQNTITGGGTAVYITDSGTDYVDNTRITHNRFEAMEDWFIYAGGQSASIEHNRFEGYSTDALVAAVQFPAHSRWNTVGTNYVALASATAYEVIDEGENNSWDSFYTRVLTSRVSGDNLSQSVVRVGDDLDRGLSLYGSYIGLGATVRLETRSDTVSSGEAIDPSLSTHVHLTGPASNVTIGTTGTDMGAVLMLTANDAAVQIVDGGTASLVGGEITLGGDSGEYGSIMLIYGGRGQWLELARSGERP